MPETQENKGEIIIYKAPDGPEIKIDFHDDSVWMTQSAISELFQTDRSSITKHLRNIVKSGEIEEKRNVQFLHIPNSDKPVKYYSLDFILSVGYRVNSRKATQFRVWATQQLRELLLKGFVMREDIKANLRELQEAILLMQQASQVKRLEGYERELLNIITDYTNTWITLNEYDKGELALDDVTKKTAKYLDYEEVNKAIARFKARLLKDGDASDLFGQEVGQKLSQVLGSIQQTFGSKEMYPSLDEKAAHLLYFAVKDHPFVDGNKRIGALLFLLFLVQNNFLINRKGERKINDTALTALTLLVAESKPSQKEVMIKLIVNLINKK